MLFKWIVYVGTNSFIVYGQDETEARGKAKRFMLNGEAITKIFKG